MQEAWWVGFFLRSSFLVFRGSTRLLRGFNGRRSFSVQWFMSVCPSEISRQTQCFYFHHSDRNPEQRSRGDCLNEDVSLFPAVLSESLLHASNVLSPSAIIVVSAAWWFFPVDGSSASCLYPSNYFFAPLQFEQSVLKGLFLPHSSSNYCSGVALQCSVHFFIYNGCSEAGSLKNIRMILVWQ